MVLTRHIGNTQLTVFDFFLFEMAKDILTLASFRYVFAQLIYLRNDPLFIK